MTNQMAGYFTIRLEVFPMVRRLLVTANVVPISPILFTLMKEALSSSETSVLTRATRRNTLEDAVLRSHRRENLKSYTATDRIWIGLDNRLTICEVARLMHRSHSTPQ
jgi:hypothetical protein